MQQQPIGAGTGSLSQAGAAGVVSPLRAVTRRLLRVEELGVLGALLVIGVVFSLMSPYFLTVNNLFQIVRQITLLGIMSVGMTFVLSAGDIDLSVGSTFNISVISMALLMQLKLPWPAAVLGGLALATLFGLINGILTVGLRIPTIIITLGTLSLFKGTSLILSNGRAITSFPKNNLFFHFGTAKLGPMPVMILVLVAAVTVGAIVLKRTVFGRHVCATGSNMKAAIHSGIRVSRVRLQVLTLMGFLCGVSGALALAHLGAADPSSGTGYELDVIAGVIIGGTKLNGGKGTVVGSIIGVTIMGTMRNGLVMLGVSPYFQTLVTGAIIITAVAVDYILKRR